jgi:hypothetical protein
LENDAPSYKAAVARMVHDAAVRTRILKDGEVNKDDLPQVLDLVSARLTANAAKDDGSPTQLFLHFDEFDLDQRNVQRKYFHDEPIVLERYYAIWQSALMPILRTPNLHLIVTGRPLELTRVGRQHRGQSPCEGLHVVLGALKEDHLMEVGFLSSLPQCRIYVHVSCSCFNTHARACVSLA